MAYVYLIVEEPCEGEKVRDWVKIGYSKNPPEWRAEANLTRGNPRTIRVAAAFEYENTADAYNAEKAAHKEFQKCLYQKEWFQIHWKEVRNWFLQQGARLRNEMEQQKA